MQIEYPAYVVPVQSNDEYSAEPSHCAFEIRPSIILKIAWYLALTRMLHRLSRSCSEVRFYFPSIAWLTLIEDENLLDQKLFEQGGFADADQIAVSFNICENSLRGHEVQLYSEGVLRLLCYHKHSGVEFFSDEISLRKLFDALRFEHVQAEVAHWMLMHKSRAILRGRGF